MSFDHELQFAKELARQAGNIARQASPLTLAITHKADNSPLTDADEAINKLVIEKVKKHFPSHNVLGEEESYTPNASTQTTWVCDPIDGTMPFTMGMSYSTFCLALVENGVPVLGVIYDFANDRMFYAVKGGGTWLNQAPLQKSTDTPMKMVDFEWWDTAPYDLSGVREKLFKKGYQVPNYTSGAYTAMMVVLGRMQGVIHASDKPWDVAATKVIAEELGILVTDLYGNEQRYDQAIKGAVIAFPDMHKELLEILKSKQK